MLTTDRVAGGALALLALFVVWESRRLPFGSLRTPGPAFVPVALAAVLLLFGLLLVVFSGKAPALSTLADKLFERPPAFTVDQFAPIALISADPTILVVPAGKPWKTAKDFIEDARKRPGQISYSSSGVYGTLHMAMELLSHATGVKLRHVPYAGAGPALTAVLGGHVDALASGPAVVLPHIKSGALRALAGWGDKRVAALPDVPTFKELGYPDAEFYIWAGVFAPKGTPEPVLRKLRETLRAAVGDPDFKAAMDKLETRSSSSRATNSRGSSRPTPADWRPAFARWGGSRPSESVVRFEQPWRF